MNGDFTADLQLGNEHERFWAKAIGATTVEAKASRHRDNTWYVEFEQDPTRSGEYKPSGIATSDTDCWLLCNVGEYAAVLVHTDLLRHAARAAYKAGRIKTTNGSDNPTRGVLVSLDDIFEFAHQWQTFT